MKKVLKAVLFGILSIVIIGALLGVALLVGYSCIDNLAHMDSHIEQGKITVESNKVTILDVYNKNEKYFDEVDNYCVKFYIENQQYTLCKNSIEIATGPSIKLKYIVAENNIYFSSIEGKIGHVVRNALGCIFCISMVAMMTWLEKKLYELFYKKTR